MDRAVMRAGRTHLAFGMTVVLMVLAFATAASAATRYVATNGNDNWAGTEAYPWRHITKAANTLVAGDTVYVKNGTYTEQVKPVNSGNSNAWINYYVYPGHTVTINGTGVNFPDWQGLVHFVYNKYIRFKGFRVVNSKWAGLFVYGNPDNPSQRAQNINLENNYISNCKFPGITAFDTDYLLISGNELNNVCNTTAPLAEAQECISITTHSSYVEIKNNYVHDSGTPYLGAEGIDVKFGSSNCSIHDNQVARCNSVGIYVDAWTESQHDIEVYNNKVWDCNGSGFGLSCEEGGTLQYVNLYNNIAWNNDLPGLMIPTYGTGTVHDCNIVNNTFYHNGYGWGGGIDIGEWTATVHDIVVRNNIISQNSDYQLKIWSRAGVYNISEDSNLIDGYRGAQDEVFGPYDFDGDPLFVNAGAGNFHLGNGSPGIDSGSCCAAVVPTFDFDYVSRPQGGSTAFDVGAFER